jgi:adenosylhomocysteinase
VQALSAIYVMNNYKKIGNRVIDVSDEIDDVVSGRKLESWGIEIDKLTEEQEKYLNSWLV